MKKITAFFLAIMPIFITVLLFASGLIVKSSTHVYVQSVQLDRNEQTVEKHSEEKDAEFDLVATVIPTNATNPELIWKTESGTDDVLSVNNQGHVACKNYGEEYVYAISKENQTLAASCKVTVTDNQVHRAYVSEEAKYDAGYIGVNQRKKIEAYPIPYSRVKDPTLDFKVSEGSDVIDVAADGTIIPKKEGKATVHINPHSGDYTSKATEITVQVGKGVQQLSLKDETESIVSSDKYNFFNDLYTFPETDVSATDFIYTSNNEDIATIDDNGIASFKDVGAAKFTATYRRNTDLKVTKSVYSSFNFINDIHFNCDEYTQNIEYKDGAYTPTVLDNTQFDCSVFPKANSKDATYIITSSDESILKPTKGSDGTYTFTALKPGKVVLVAQAFTGASLTSLVNDACLVTITSLDSGVDKGLISKPTTTLEDGMFYYPLVNSLNLQADKRTPYSIFYKISEGDDVAYLDDNNIIHFTAEGTAKVTVSIDDTEIGSISVTSESKPNSLEIISGKDSYVIEVGKQYKINNGSPVFEELLFSKPYAKYFDYDSTTEVFIAKNGSNIENFEVLMSDGSTRYINLIVKEDPICITSSLTPYLSTTEVEYNFKKQAGCAIVPSTATKADGTNYTLSYSYDFDSEHAKVEDDNITFTAPAIVEITTSYDDVEEHKLHSYLKSTYGSMSKFILKDANNKSVISNSDYTYDGTPLVFSVYDLTRSEANQIEAEAVSQTELFDIKKELINETILGTYKEVRFTLTPKTELYGTETICIKNKIYALYINVKVPATITDFQISYGREFLSSTEENNSFASDLTLNILPYPALEKTTATGTYTVKLGDTDLPVTNNTVNITDLTGEQDLKIYVAGSSEPLKTFKLVKKEYSDLKISITGADKNNLYMGAKETQRILYLRANGLVPTTFWNSDKFTITTSDEQVKTVVTQDIVNIKGIPDPDGNQYSLSLTLKYDTTELGTYTLTRDIVSKIVLPGYDNDDMTDKKGLQKVHVYGDSNFYTKEGHVSFLKINPKIYDYKSEEITDLAKKTDAVNTLTWSISNNSTALYDGTDGCFHITFSQESRYNTKEISLNEFDAKTAPKNVDFKVSTHSNNASAKYTFVTVTGVNVYTQEDLKKTVENRWPIVLQTNFGLDGEESKDNQKLEFELGEILGVHGNGYTMCETWGFLNDKTNFSAPYFFNVNLQGCSSNLYQKITPNTNHNIQMVFVDQTVKYFMYSIYSNFSNGLNTGWGVTSDKNQLFIKNSLFLNNKVCSFEGNNKDDQTYIENCLFINSGTIPILVEKDSSMHFKGYIGLYNFQSKEMLKNIFGYDLTSLWPIVEKTSIDAGMAEKGYDGRIYVNSFMATALSNNIYFWNEKLQQYEKGVKGTADAANYTGKFIDVGIPLTKITASLWGTITKKIDPNAFSYYDMYDENGNIKQDLLQSLIPKITRKPIYF